MDTYTSRTGVVSGTYAPSYSALVYVGEVVGQKSLTPTSVSVFMAHGYNNGFWSWQNRSLTDITPDGWWLRLISLQELHLRTLFWLESRPGKLPDVRRQQHRRVDTT